MHAGRAHPIRILRIDVGSVAQGRIDVREAPIFGGIPELGSQQGEREARVVAACEGGGRGVARGCRACLFIRHVASPACATVRVRGRGEGRGKGGRACMRRVAREDVGEGRAWLDGGLGEEGRWWRGLEVRCT